MLQRLLDLVLGEPRAELRAALGRGVSHRVERLDVGGLVVSPRPREERADHGLPLVLAQEVSQLGVAPPGEEVLHRIAQRAPVVVQHAAGGVIGVHEHGHEGLVHHALSGQRKQPALELLHALGQTHGRDPSAR